MSKSSMSQYREAQISSASPEKTVLMLYDGAIRFLKSAINELEVNNNIPEKALLVEKTVKIIEYLHSCLDKDNGGEISTNLENLYNYMIIQLTRGNLNNDKNKLEEILGLLNTVREGWNGISDNNKTQQNMPSAYNATSGANVPETSIEPVNEPRIVIKA